MTADRLRALALDARQRRLLDIVDVAVRLEEMPRIPGRARLVQVLKELDANGSDFASSVRQRLNDEGFAPSTHPVPITAVSGETVHLDIAFIPERVAIGCQGFLARPSRRQPGSDASGWLVLELTWDRYLHDWEGFVGELRAVLEARRPGMRPMWLVSGPAGP
jgi:hypothetical protein